MAKALLLGAAFGLSMMTAAGAQSEGARSPDGGRPAGGIRSGNITATGATVPNPGVSQGDGVTPLDKGIQREDDRITSGICKGC